jgi:hypothetical protein
VLSSTTASLIGGTAINAVGRISISLAGKYKLLVTDTPATPGDPIAEAVTSAEFVIKALK